MHNPIKRVWVPKPAPTAPAPLVAETAPAPTAPQADTPSDATPSKRAMLFDELPEPEVSEKFSDSVWAAFDSVLPQSAKVK